jgi:predicted aldo/keto reductase-like oxidoreductase
VENASNAYAGEFTKDDDALLENVVKAINEKMKVGCTGCGYCMPCPKMVDIPGTFAAYNISAIDGRQKAVWDYLKCTLLRKESAAASNCVGCGLCEKHCPQGIEIAKEMRKIDKFIDDLRRNVNA